MNNEASETASTTLREAMYDYASAESKPRHVPEGVSRVVPRTDVLQGEQQPQARYVSLPKRDEETGSDPAANIYSVIAGVRNSVPYQSPPNSEEEIYSTLKHKIYVHLDRTSIHKDRQIGVG